MAVRPVSSSCMHACMHEVKGWGEIVPLPSPPPRRRQQCLHTWMNDCILDVVAAPSMCGAGGRPSAQLPPWWCLADGRRERGAAPGPSPPTLLPWELARFRRAEHAPSPLPPLHGGGLPCGVLAAPCPPHDDMGDSAAGVDGRPVPSPASPAGSGMREPRGDRSDAAGLAAPGMNGASGAASGAQKGVGIGEGAAAPVASPWPPLPPLLLRVPFMSPSFQAKPGALVVHASARSLAVCDWSVREGRPKSGVPVQHGHATLNTGYPSWVRSL
eukprot:364231-Chlamydomonas_euryale.AAC.6